MIKQLTMALFILGYSGSMILQPTNSYAQVYAQQTKQEQTVKTSNISGDLEKKIKNLDETYDDARSISTEAQELLKNGKYKDVIDKYTEFNSIIEKFFSESDSLYSVLPNPVTCYDSSQVFRLKNDYFFSFKAIIEEEKDLNEILGDSKIMLSDDVRNGINALVTKAAQIIADCRNNMQYHTKLTFGRDN